MTTIELTEVTVGNAQYDAVLSVSDEVLAIIQREGALRILQGAPSGAAEKALAYPGKGVKRPAGFSRTDIPFSPAMTTEFEKQYSVAEIEIGRNDKDEAIKVAAFEECAFVWREKPESGYVPKFATEKLVVTQYLFEADGKTPKLKKDGTARTTDSLIALYARYGEVPQPVEPWEEDTAFLSAFKAAYDAFKADAAPKD